MSSVVDCLSDGDRVEIVGLASLRESDCRAAIERATDFIVVGRPTETYAQYDSGALWIGFVLASRILYEDEFYNHVRLHCPGAVPELRKLIEKRNAYLDYEIRSGTIFAAFALAWLDEASLPLVARFFHAFDAEHNDEFTEKEVGELVARHGWSLRMIDFTIVWLELADSSSGGDRPLDSGLRAGARVFMSAENFARRYHDVLDQHGIGAYSEREDQWETGWHPDCYFGTHAADRMWFDYYQSFGEYIGYFGPEQTNRTHASFQKIVDGTSWLSLARTHCLNDWDRTFFITFRQIANAIQPLPKTPSRP